MTNTIQTRAAMERAGRNDDRQWNDDPQAVANRLQSEAMSAGFHAVIDDSISQTVKLTEQSTRTNARRRGLETAGRAGRLGAAFDIDQYATEFAAGYDLGRDLGAELAAGWWAKSLPAGINMGQLHDLAVERINAIAQEA